MADPNSAPISWDCNKVGGCAAGICLLEQLVIIRTEEDKRRRRCAGRYAGDYSQIRAGAGLRPAFHEARGKSSVRTAARQGDEIVDAIRASENAIVEGLLERATRSGASR